jgi:hypothetical protein
MDTAIRKHPYLFPLTGPGEKNAHPALPDSVYEIQPIRFVFTIKIIRLFALNSQANFLHWFGACDSFSPVFSVPPVA